LRSGKGAVKVRVLEAIARDAAMYWPTLAPRGGTRWTTEDADRAVSILYGVTQKDAFHARFSRGRVSVDARRYLLTALRNELLETQKRRQRIEWLDPVSLDALPGDPPEHNAGRPEETTDLAAELHREFTTAERREFRLRHRGQGPGSSRVVRSSAVEGPSLRTRGRLWRSLSDKIVEFARLNRLADREMKEVFRALALQRVFAKTENDDPEKEGRIIDLHWSPKTSISGTGAGNPALR